MKIIVNSKEITLALDEVPVNSGEYNIRDCEFQFSPEYEGLLKTCVFTKFGVTYKRDIIDSKCQIPYEVLSSEGRVIVGVYGYEIQNEKIVMRYSPKPASFTIEAGSYVEDNEEGGLDPTEYELLLYIIASSMEEVERDYQKKLTAGNGIAIENNVIRTDLFIPEKTSDIRNDSDFVNSNTQTLRYYGNSIEILLNPSTYVMTCKLKNYDGLVLSSMDIDLPIESMIVDGSYDSQTKELVLTLQSGTVIRISISDIITGLVPETRTIAGLNLEDDITSNELSNALGVPTKTSDLVNDSNFVSNDTNQLTNYELKADVGHSVELSINSQTFVLTLNLKNSAGTTISTQTIDLPLETMVVSGSYDDTTKKIILTLVNGQTIEFSVADLVSGLQSEITSNNKLSADLVDDTLTNNKFVTANEKSAIGTAEQTSNKVTSITSSSTNTEYPSALAVKTYVDTAISTSITQAIGGSY